VNRVYILVFYVIIFVIVFGGKRMTLTEQRKTEDGQIELLIQLDSEEMDSAASKEFNRMRRNLTVPGFRKGKVPRAIAERMHGQLFFYEEALNSMIQDVYLKALDESGVEVIDQPRITIDEMSVEDGVKLIFSVTPYPELTVKEYKGLKATKRVYPVLESDIQFEIESLMEKNSRLVTVEDRPAQLEDIAVIDFEGFVDDTAFDGGKGEDFNLTLGSGQFIPGFEEQVAGHNAGEEFDVKVTFPEDYSSEQLAGKEAVFKVKLREIRKKELPELDDEFAKDVSEFDTLDELKKDIEKRMGAEREERSDVEVENSLGIKLAEQLEGEVPEVMIMSRIDELVRDFSYRMSSQGLDLNTYLSYSGQDIEEFRDGFRENAGNQVRVRLALEAVVRAESISVTDEEVEAEYAKSAEAYKMDIEKIKEMIADTAVRKDLAVNKALEFIKENADIEIEQNVEDSDLPESVSDDDGE